MAPSGITRDQFQNQTIGKLDEIIARHAGDGPAWNERIIRTELVMGTFIYQEPGGGNRKHYHTVENEFWVVLKGTIEWEFDDEKVIAKAGDVVLAKAGRWHKITAIGDEPTVRFAVVAPDVPHLFE